MRKHQEDVGYRLYTTTCLQLIPQGKYLQKSYEDCLKKPDRRSGDEIAKEVIRAAGLRI